MRRKKIFFFRALKGVTLIFGIAFLVYGVNLWLKSDFWRVKKIDCQMNGQSCPPELRGALMGLLQGENALFLSPSSFSAKVKEAHRWIDSVEIKKRLPDGLELYLKERKPKVALVVEGSEGGEFYLLDEEGVLLEKTTSPPDLPLVFVGYLPELAIGAGVRQESIHQAILLLQDLKLRLLNPRLAKIVSEKEIEVWLKEETRAIFSLKKDLPSQVDSLQLIFSRTKIGGRSLKRIDLRFDKPVIVY